MPAFNPGTAQATPAGQRRTRATLQVRTAGLRFEAVWTLSCLQQARRVWGSWIAVAATADAVASYVPDLLQRRLADHPESIAKPYADLVIGAVLLADIAGFTAITEQLARQGPGGAEALSGLLNGAFGSLLGQIAAAGGDVLKFAGDALLVCWPALDEEPAAGLALATRRAVGCAQAMQATLQDYAAAEEIELSLRIGVSAGEVVLLDVGGTLDRRELLVGGSAVPQMTTATRAAQPGQVVVAPEAWALVEDVCVGERAAGGVRLLSAPPTPPTETGSRYPSPDGLAGVLVPYLPRALLGSLRAGHAEWLAELRRVTLLFVNLPGLDHTATLEQAQQAMQALQTALYRYEGSINKLSVDDKGTMLVAALGLPPLAHEDDPARAVQAALAMRAALTGLGERSAIGVTTGRVFCGVVGDQRRREYTMLGAVVNLAARLMQAAAPGGILCDAATAQAAGAAIAFEELPAVKLKGHTDPVAVYRPRDRAVARPGPAWRDPLGPLVGRTAERKRLAEQLRMLVVQTGNGDPRLASVVALEGEAGMGKSRLVAELVEQARAAGVRVLAGAGDAIERNTPFYAWREIFVRLPAIDAAGDTEARRHAILDLLGPDPETRELAPLLNAVLPLDWPETARTAELSPQGRADHTRSLLVRLLQAAIGGTPTVLVLEDAHWLDSASSALALAVGRAITPLLMVLATRPPDEQGALVDDLGWAAYRRLLQAPGTTRLILGALSPEDVEALICHRLGVTAVPEVVASFIHEKAEGSPLFSEELAYALRDAKLIQLVGGRCQLAPGVGDISVHFPDTVHGVITSRIDRLTPHQQLTLKVASVIGRVFALRLLRDIYPVKETPSTLADDLVALEAANLTVLDHPEPHLAYLFKHVITQEAAYNLMLASQRQQLHRTIAEWYEHTHAGDLRSHAPLLAYHWQGADVPDKAIDYLEEAGGQALRTGAYREAVRLFSRLLDLDDRTRQAGEPAWDSRSTARHISPDASNIRRARWERQLGDAHLGLGQLRPAREHLHTALALLNRRMPASGRRLAVRLGWQILQQARNRLWPRSPVARAVETRDALLEAAEVYKRLYVLDLYANRRTEAIHEAVKGLNLAEAAGSEGAVAQLMVVCGLSLGFLARHRLAQTYIKRAFTGVDKPADPAVRAWVLQFAAMYDMGMGRWVAATDQLDQAATLTRRVGDRRRLGEINALRACVAHFQGDLARAASLVAELRWYGSQGRNTQMQAWALLAQASYAVRSGDLDQAMLVLQDRRAPALEALLHLRHGAWQPAGTAVQAALEPVRAAPIKCYWYELYATTAEVAIALWHVSRHRDIGDQASLRAAAEQAMRAMRRYAKAFPIGQPRALLCQGLLAWIDEQPLRARKAWRRSLAAAERLGMRYDQMLAHQLLGRHGDPSERDEHLARARQLFAQLGIGDKVPGPDALAAHFP
jgi:class 3 adenylate cyclase